MFESKVLKNEQLTSSTFMLRVERQNLKIKSGQCFNIGLPNTGINREYSIYSDTNADFIEFLIREVEMGVVTTELKKLTAGDKVQLAGPYGEFCIENSINAGSEDFTFIGTGTGIAPFRSFIKSFPKINYKIIHGIREVGEEYHQNEYLNECYIPCISRPRNNEKPVRVTDYLKGNDLNKGTVIYICGNRKMIDEVYDICRQKGVSGNNLFTEVFF
jgi:ferredoxin/flavodoxin---NADP+ reductase